MHSICKQLLVGSTKKSGEKVDICGLHGSSSALFASQLQEAAGKTICCVVSSDDLLESLACDISLFTTTPVVSFPAFEIAPYGQLTPDTTTLAIRLSTLYLLQESNQPCIVLTSAEALLRRIIPRQRLAGACELVMTGEETDRDKLILALSNTGYQQAELVQQPGDMAVRGGIIDLYPPASTLEQQGPVRLDFFGDTVESIRTFDPASQRSQGELEELVILPASDILFGQGQEKISKQKSVKAAAKMSIDDPLAREAAEQLRQGVRFPGIEFLLPLIYQNPKPQTLFDYLQDTTPFLLHDPVEIKRKVELVWERIGVNYIEAAALRAAPPPETLFLSAASLDDSLARSLQINICPLPDPDSKRTPLIIPTGDHSLLRQEIDLERKKRGVLAPLADRLLHWQKQNETTILACRSSRQADHFEEMLAHYPLSIGRSTVPLSLAPAPGQLSLVEHPLSSGFDLVEEKLHILSAAELFGEKRLRRGGRRKGKKGSGVPVALDQLTVEDIVVHREHGLAAFKGLVNMEFSGQRGDYMLLEFRGNDKLYIPVDQLSQVSRYQGLTDQQPALDRLGSSKWKTKRKKVKEAVWQIAQELLEIYAKRELRRGHAFEPGGTLYHELAESFPYDETDGQARAIDDVMRDLLSEQPMDRLICGDVGYGKTEVAVRAAYKVMEDGFQVAVLVPTTVLAEQHAVTFQERFSEFGIEVACLNRFRTPRQQRQIIKEVNEGQVGLLVGTHRLLSKDVSFKKLGLLIVDEEHRFGVSHKEKIKKMRAGVDVMTLTATPIPRTLQMSLLGIRDLSVISSPPRHRRSVKTFLARLDDLVIREAVVQELARGGQTFFVHNRVKSIHRIADKIEKLVPHARIAVAHGQMPSRNLEEIMVSFVNHEIDVLVCTTIIESGLDIPNANTIIINRADHLGLADIYQLRGRVGRSSRQAYAYLLVPSLDKMTSDAGQRLRALMDHSELGGGFKLAMSDLQIRGGGNLLGVSQSGHIAAVGYDLYLELLQSTVADLKRQAAGGGDLLEEELDPEIKLKVAAYLPDDYVRDTTQRFQLYRRISSAGNQDPDLLADLRDELIDRFGPLPLEGDTLFEMIGLKYPLRKLGISKLEQGPGNLVFSFTESTPVESEVLLKLIAAHEPKKKKGWHKPGPAPIRLTPDQRLVVTIKDEENLFFEIDDIIQALGFSG